MDRNKIKVFKHKRRKRRVRKKVVGSPERPRLAVFRSLKHIYAQIIDDFAAVTKVSASTLSAEVRSAFSNCGNVKAAEAVGELVAKRALEAGIKKVVFDRSGYKFHGRVKALAEGARKAGLEF